MTDPLTLIEGGAAAKVSLTRAEYRALKDCGIVRVTPTLDEGVFEVAAGWRVGAVAIGTRQVVVKPKISDLNRLLFLLGYARDPRIWRDDPIQLDPADELLPAVAEAFARIATLAVEQGLLQGYKTMREDLPVLRGRILAGEQMSRLYGLPLPLAVEYDDFTVDVAENQLLVMATMRLLNMPRLSGLARKLLQRLRRSLAEVTMLPRGAVKPVWQPSRLNARYQPALRLADIVLATESFEHRIGDILVTGYMFDMWRIFEDFVTVAIGESLAERGWQCRPQAQMFLDESRNVELKPDLLCLSGAGSVAVIDAKYKAERPEGFPNADLYQMLSYCSVLGLADGHLVYAKGNESERVHTVQNSGVAIHCHALDLALEPDRLLRQVDKLAADISSQSIAVGELKVG
ncbi:5-methylcytosine-specific restriction enzyme subunit McrC [Mycolicibacterium neoaurum]|uniref:McrC family protein n=1 Tax=Mycolicibacterium neoaurum TaxID=1795 RepID=UPI00056D91C2|nr:restriction endonuclease [Mycolicibacterium neoaurum]SDF04666.1 5-methylcytosine-specific restriction enzyme subunit McrC [Mycolicibacterium neoaurum]